MFGGSKPDSTTDKTNEFMEQHGLTGLSPEYRYAAEKASADLVRIQNFQLQGMLNGMSKENICNIQLLSAIAEQNWIIIRELDKLTKRS